MSWRGLQMVTNETILDVISAFVDERHSAEAQGSPSASSQKHQNGHPALTLECLRDHP
jgi:hypothetical protein